jgi:hypothetical protein
MGVDAFPDRKYSGKVIEVANIGEQRPNSDAKVFEVKIVLLQSDTTLRPAMTTSNSIITAKSDTSLYAPSECVFRNDSLSYVYVEGPSGLRRREVITGLYNENQTVLLAGVKAEEMVYLSAPEGADDAAWELLSSEEKERWAAEPEDDQPADGLPGDSLAGEALLPESDVKPKTPARRGGAPPPPAGRL